MIREDRVRDERPVRPTRTRRDAGDDHAGDDHAGDAPYLPPSLPPAAPVVPVAPMPAPPSEAAPSEAAPSQAGDAPILPSTPRAAPAAEPEPVAFDAKTLVESQKRVVQNPAYGPIPKATPESVAALEALRARARRKRRRNRIIGWVDRTADARRDRHRRLVRLSGLPRRSRPTGCRSGGGTGRWHFGRTGGPHAARQPARRDRRTR